MKNILLGILSGTLIVPIATILYQIVSWFRFDFSESNLSFTDMLGYGAFNGVFGAVFALVVLTIYGAPLFIILRHFNLANWLSVSIFCILPWVVVDGIMNKDIHHFIEFSWYSLASGFAFWYLARRSIKQNAINT